MAEFEGKSYRYLRMTIVVLLLGIAVAVLYQTGRQEFHLLGSISAYYYTPAQAIFVGGLIAVGACMIALKGTTETEDVFLNLGGAAAAVVAIVPTTRGEDFETAVRACREAAAGPLLTEQAPSPFDCPTVQALEEATRANVENNMTTLLVLGGLSLVVTVAFVVADRRRSSGRLSPKLVAGFLLSVALWLLACLALWTRPDLVLSYAHYVAAVGLGGCIFVVTMSNAMRRHGTQSPPGSMATKMLAAVRDAFGALFRWPPDRYVAVAWAMIAGVGVAGTLFLLGAVTLFWLEVVVAVLFLAFWLVQTAELAGGEPARLATAQSQPGPASTSVRP